MKPSVVAAAGFFAALLLGSAGAARACGIAWQVPVNHFDGVNEFGKLSYWRKIGDVDLGDGLNIPLILGFNPTRRNSSPLGNGWFLGPMDASLVQIDERKFLLTQPDGILREFWKNVPTDTILQGQGGWKGEIKGKTITLWAQCGWRLVFSSGKIHSITTPQSRVLNFVYGDDGKVSQIQENGEPVLRTDVDEKGNINGLTYGNKQIGIKHIGIDLAERPRVDVINGMNLVGGMQQSLHKVTMPDGTEETYDFAVNNAIQPTLKVVGGNERSFTWSPATGQAIKVGEWTYIIHPDADAYKNARIERTNAEKQSEYWFLDKVNGTETTKNSDGTQTIRKWFVTGLVSGLERTCETYKNGKLLKFERCAYDETGALLRVLRNDTVINYQYGKPSAVFIGDRLVWSLEYSPNGSVKKLVYNPDE
jgi:hypothetical protein